MPGLLQNGAELRQKGRCGVSETTPNGVPIVDCEQCGGMHPEPRKHCQQCGRASLFIVEGLCSLCDGQGAP